MSVVSISKDIIYSSFYLTSVRWRQYSIKWHFTKNQNGFKNQNINCNILRKKLYIFHWTTCIQFFIVLSLLVHDKEAELYLHYYDVCTCFVLDIWRLHFVHTYTLCKHMYCFVIKRYFIRKIHFFLSVQVFVGASGHHLITDKVRVFFNLWWHISAPTCQRAT